MTPYDLAVAVAPGTGPFWSRPAMPCSACPPGSDDTLARVPRSGNSLHLGCENWGSRFRAILIFASGARRQAVSAHRRQARLAAATSTRNACRYMAKGRLPRGHAGIDRARPPRPPSEQTETRSPREPTALCPVDPAASFRKKCGGRSWISARMRRSRAFAIGHPDLQAGRVRANWRS